MLSNSDSLVLELISKEITILKRKDLIIPMTDNNLIEYYIGIIRDENFWMLKRELSNIGRET